MENCSAYRITTSAGVVIADDLMRSSPAIQLHEGVLSKDNKHPKDLDPGESTIVAYPLVEGRLICRVSRTVGDLQVATGPIEFTEPDPVAKRPKRNPTTEAFDAHYAAESPVKVRRGRKVVP